MTQVFRLGPTVLAALRRSFAAYLGAAAVIVFVNAHTVLAQSTDRNPLASVKSLKCRFPVYAVGSWKNGDPQAQVKQAQGISLEIDEIDVEAGTARVTGTSGAVHVTALLTLSSLHFMERSVTGTLNIITVFAPEDDALQARAVNSRHDYLPIRMPGFVSEPLVTQNYGVCEIGR